MEYWNDGLRRGKNIRGFAPRHYYNLPTFHADSITSRLRSGTTEFPGKSDNSIPLALT